MLIESLEKRLAPAGLVVATVSGGVLTLTGDVADNAFTVTEIGAGEFRITGQLDTLIQIKGQAPGATADVANAGKGITLNLLGGNDYATLEGVSLTGNLTANMGAGDNGVILLGATEVGGNLSYTGGAGTDGFTADGDLTVGGTTVLTMGAGDSATGFVINTVLRLGKGLTMSAGNGTDNVIIGGGEGVDITGSAIFNLGGGGNTVLFQTPDLAITGGLSLTNAGHPDLESSLTVQADEVRIGGGVTVRNGNGTSGVAFLATDLLQIGGGVNVAHGSGFHVTQFSTEGVVRIAGDFVVNHTGVQIVSETLINGAQVLIGGDFTVNHGGAQAGSSTAITAGIVNIGGDLAVKFGAGPAAVNLLAPDGNVSGLLVVGGDLAISYGGNTGTQVTDTAIRFGEVRVGGKLAITAGHGVYTHEIDTQVLDVAEGISVTNGNVTPDVEGATTSTLIRGSVIATTGLSVTNGRGLVSTSLFSDQAQIQGDVVIRNAGGLMTSSATSLEGSFEIGGNLKVMNGLGAHSITLQIATAIALGGSLTMDHASGGADQALARVTFTGGRLQVGNDLTIRYGHGSAETVMSGSELLVGDDLAILHGNSATAERNSDTLALTSILSVGGDMALRGGAGDFYHTISAPTLTIQGGLSVGHGRHENVEAGFTMSGDRVTIRGMITSYHAVGGPTGILLTAGELDIGGIIAYNGAGADALMMTANVITVRGDIMLRNGHGESTIGILAATGLNMYGSLTMLGGAGNDAMSITGGGQVRGSITGSFGAGAIVEVELRGLTIGGALNLGASAETATKITLESLQVGRAFYFTGGNLVDDLNIGLSQFASTVSIRLGAGDDLLAFNDTRVKGNITVLTGAGDDDVTFGALNGSTPTLFGGAVILRLDAGDDTLNFQNSGGTTVFQKSVLLDGGPGTDTLVDGIEGPSAPIFLSGPPTVVNFEGKGNG